MKRKVIVFGASGEIGGRIARLAADAGHRVYGVSRGTNLRDTVDLSGVQMLHGDKNDETFLRDVVSKLDIDAVIDSVPSLESVDLYMKYLPRAGNVFFCSSTGTFVPLQCFPADENHPWREETPVNFYRQCRRDDYALRMYAEKEFPVTIFRPTNIIGEDRVPLELWGGRNIEFYRDLQAGRPVTIPACEQVMVQSGYNWDLASAFVLGLTQPEEVRGELFIISCKQAITLGRYLQTAMEFLGSKSEIRHAAVEELPGIYPDASFGGIPFLLEPMCLDIGKAERVLGYSPSKTTEEGLIAALSWCVNSGLLKS
jgi:nucleoside-diphosphate-sugar epimerase